MSLVVLLKEGEQVHKDDFRKIHIAELTLWRLLELVFSDYYFEDDNLDTIKKKDSEKVIGQVKLKSTKRVWYFINILRSALSLIKDESKCQVVRYHLKILEGLFRLAVSEEIHIVAFCRSRVTCGWQVVTEDNTDPYQEINNYFPHYFSRLQNLHVGSFHLSYDVCLKAPRVEVGCEVLGGVREEYIRIYSLKDSIADFDEEIVRLSEEEASKEKIDFFHNFSEYLASVYELVDACFICFVREQVNHRFDDQNIRVYEEFRIVREKEDVSPDDTFEMEYEEVVRFIDDHFESLCLAADPGKDNVPCPNEKILQMCVVVES